MWLYRVLNDCNRLSASDLHDRRTVNAGVESELISIATDNDDNYY